MKLSTDQTRIVSLLATLFPGDLVLATTKALGEIPDVPEFRSAFQHKIDDGISVLQTFRASVTSNATPAATGKASGGAPGATAGAVEDAVPGSIRDRILTYLKANPKSDAGSIRTAIGTATGGGFAAALRVGIDKGQIIAHDPPASGGVKTYSLRA